MLTRQFYANKRAKFKSALKAAFLNISIFRNVQHRTWVSVSGHFISQYVRNYVYIKSF